MVARARKPQESFQEYRANLIREAKALKNKRYYHWDGIGGTSASPGVFARIESNTRGKLTTEQAQVLSDAVRSPVTVENVREIAAGMPSLFAAMNTFLPGIVDRAKNGNLNRYSLTAAINQAAKHL